MEKKKVTKLGILLAMKLKIFQSGIECFFTAAACEIVPSLAIFNL